VISAQSYQVQLRVKNTLNWGGTTTANNQLVFSSLLPNTTYEFRVRTSCVAGLTEQNTSDLSSIDTFKTPAEVICSTPVNLSLVATNSTTATVSWSNEINALLYNIQIRPKNTATWGGTSVADTVFTFTSLSPSTTYEFRVRSACESSIATSPTSAFSMISEFTTGSAALGNCMSPSNISASATANSISLSWDSANNGQLYFVQYKLSTSLTWGGTSTSNTQLTLANLSPNTQYQFRLRTTCQAGTTITPMSTFSNVGSINTGSLREWFDNTNNGIYPNPTSGLVTIVRNNSMADVYHVSLTDIAGRVLHQTNIDCAEGSTTWSYNLAMYPQGLYFIRVTDKSGSVQIYRVQRM
jgi:hypothetical protein